MRKVLYYILNIVWGLPMTLIGFFCALSLICTKHRVNTHGGCLWFTVGENWGGVSLGLVIITDTSTPESTLNHEFGHSIQNAMYGVLFPFIVAIPSALRYQRRRILEAKGVELEPYDAVWFEGQATRLGDKYISSF